jgi:peptidoglycan hydrolase-like protein with peptidoglycan-binding domain
MPLSSPRFRNEPKLQATEGGTHLLKSGVIGREVHLVQMALIDLGFPMPLSTTSSHFSPDGIYGDETTAVVKKFQQTKPWLSVDGEVGPETLRELDALFPSFTHRVNLHFRSLSLSDVPFNTLMSGLERVYAQYSIEARFASGESLKLSPAEEARFSVVRQDCDWDMDAGEFADLEQMGTAVPPNDIAVYIVNSFQEANVLGCGGHAAHRPACAVTHNCGQFDPAHEVGHVLLTSGFSPVHANDDRNLMYAFSSARTNPLMLTEKQLKRIRASTLCRMI